jgi:two-component system sensor kinase FixL
MIQEVINHLTPARRWGMGSRSWLLPRAWLAVALYAGYIALYLTLDRISFIEALYGIGITPWNPSAGLTVALLIMKGPRCFPAVLSAEVLSTATLPLVPIPAFPVFAAGLVVSVGYASATVVLRLVGFDASLRRTSDVAVLLGVMMISSAIIANGCVATYSAAGVIPWQGFIEAAFQYWVGDAIGIFVLAPSLLILNQVMKRAAPRKHGWRLLQIGELAAQVASIVMALMAVFSQIGGDHAFGLFYLLFLPLIWIATRHGLAAASWAVLAIQLGLVVGLEICHLSETSLKAFQLLMFALATTGLVLGAVVSERRRLSGALANSESHRATILNTARDGILTIDSRGQIRSINPAVERLFAEPGELLIGRNVREFVEAAPDLLRRMSGGTCSSNAEAVSCELEAQRADGSVFPIELSVGRFASPATAQYTLVIRDITLRRQAETRAREHQTELAHVSRISLAGEMAAGLAHELNQPLTAIAAFGRGCLRLLAAPTGEPAMLQQGVSEIVQQAERAGDVLSRLREFMRGGARRPALVGVGSLIDAAVSLAQIETTQHPLDIEVDIEPDLPPVMVDPIQIEQVILNLVRNAIEAMGTVTTKQSSIIVAAHRNNSRTIEISVADTGPGVSEELVAKIFEPFVTTKPLGMGMGLSISRSMVESHGGHLWVATTAGSGSIFAFDLPTEGALPNNVAGEDLVWPAAAASGLLSRT